MAAPRYPQPTRIELPFKVLVVRADPDYEQAKRNEVFYEFTGRVFKGNNALRGAYTPSSD